MNPNYPRIWQTIAGIPAGRVASYGQVALLAGLPGRARLVGRALRETPDDVELPWHRVLNASGRLAFPVDSESYREQRTRLLSEGVLFSGGRIDLARFGVETRGLDALLWDPQRWESV